MSGLVLGVSGSREALSEIWYPTVSERVYRAKLAGYTRLVQGACKGIDEIALMAGRYHRLHTHSILPTMRGSLARTWKVYSDSYEESPAGSSFLERDQLIVDQSDALLALPLYREDHPKSKRSGTWATIRMARRKAIPIRILVLTDIDPISSAMPEAMPLL